MPADLYAGISRDYLVIDGLGPVTFREMTRTGHTDYAIPHAEGHEINIRDVDASGGLWQSQDVLRVIWRAEIDDVSAPDPKPGDKILVGTEAWSIISVVKNDLDLCFDLVTRKDR